MNFLASGDALALAFDIAEILAKLLAFAPFKVVIELNFIGGKFELLLIL